MLAFFNIFKRKNSCVILGRLFSNYSGLILASLREEFGLIAQTLPSKTPSPPPSAAGEKAQGGEKLVFFYKNPIFLSPKTPLSTTEYLSSYLKQLKTQQIYQIDCD
jgi:hypothetical protein